jgi:hypothetical protein
MKRFMLAIPVILCVLMAAVAIAQEATEHQKPAKAKAHTGEVTSIDAAKNEIVIKDSAGAEVRLLVSTSTKITKAGKTIPFADLKVGDKLATECDMSADGCTAKHITVMPTAPSQ